MTPGPIGIFDSGYGGLTVFRDIHALLPGYDYIYLGDNARTPYGTRSHDMVYRFTLECVEYLFEQGCHLVILACNSASANALRTIQQNDLESFGDHKRVLGVIRPTTERLATLSQTGHIGICATEATVRSGSYLIEAHKYAQGLEIHQQACPLWVPLVEAGELDSEVTHLITQRYITELLRRDDRIDAVLLACTHYPLLWDVIRDELPDEVELFSQGRMVAEALVDYLERHPEMDALCSKDGGIRFLTTDDPKDFDAHGSQFFGQPVRSESVDIGKRKS